MVSFIGSGGSSAALLGAITQVLFVNCQDRRNWGGQGGTCPPTFWHISNKTLKASCRSTVVSVLGSHQGEPGSIPSW